MFCLQDTGNEDYIAKLGNHVDGGDGRHPPASPETGENALARDLTGGNAVDEELGELRGQDIGGQVGQAQHVNQVDHEDTGTHNVNDLGFLVSEWREVLCSARRAPLAPNLALVKAVLGFAFICLSPP